MVIAVLRNLRSRATRTALTVSGIAIGILALVVVGSLAERLQTIVARSGALNSDAVFALATNVDRFGGDAEAHLRGATATIKSFGGVRAVVPEVILPYARGGSDGRFGPPALVFGFPPQARAFRAESPAIASGRDLRDDDDRAVVIGADFAAAEHARVGSAIAIYGNSFHVVGIIEKSFTVFDAALVVPFVQAQALMRQNVPPSVAALPSAPATALMVIVVPGADTGVLARRITLLTGLQARDPKEAAANFQSATSIFDAIIFGAALIALLVGAFSIVNTMTIAVTERTREIGIRKAIGAGEGDIVREFLIEAAVIGAIGGAAGILAGALVVMAVNARNAAGGSLELFALTPRLIAGSFGFSLALSVLAGLVPAFSAARLDPTEALRRNT
ncbi:MAG: ABC transporter permease [Candidatus Velthaea sp.]